MTRTVTTQVGGRGRQGEEENAVDIRLGKYNIRNGNNRGLTLDLCALDQANMKLGVLFDTNIMKSVYMCRSSEYNVIASEDLSKN